MHADVHEGAEGGDVGHDAGELHAGTQILGFVDAGVEGEGLELGAWIATGFGELGEDVLQRGQADGVGDVGLEFDFGAGFAVAKEVGDGAADVGGHFFHEGVALGVDGGGVERVGGVVDAEETGGLLEGLGA